MNNTASEILFDKFEIIDCLKKDTLTCVYIANHTFLGKKIILKTLKTDELDDKSILERFKREAKILAQLDHKNLIKVFDFGSYKNFVYISFEYFESKNLREVIKNNNLSLEDKRSLVIQLLMALNAAHKKNIVHRDIKPENILVNTNLHLKIADFGLALISNENNLTQNSSIVGTPGYMSPEQIRGEKSQQTDLFSLGIVIYELYTGKNPFLGDNVSETINNILNKKEEDYIEQLKVIPEDIRQIVQSLLKKNLRERPKTASEVLNILDNSSDGKNYKNEFKNRKKIQ